MTRREWRLSRKAFAFGVATLALVAVVPVSMMLTADRPGGHGSRVLHGRGTTPADPATGGKSDGTGDSDQSLGGGSQTSSGQNTVDTTHTSTATSTTTSTPTEHASHQQPGNSGAGGAVPDSAENAFGVVVGSLHGLYPGRHLQLPVTYQNRHSFAIRVISARVAASLVSSSPGVPMCSSSQLAFSPWSSRAGIAVPEHGSAHSALPLRLKPSAPDACKGARWRVTVTAQAVR